VWAEGLTEQNRLISRSPRVSAATVGIGGEDASLSLNGVAREGAASALSLRARARPAAGFGIEAEAARAGDAGAMHVHAYGALPGVSLDLRALEADAAFPGEQHGRSLRSAYAAARPLARIRLHAAYEREAREDTLGSLLEIGRRSSTRRLGASLGDALTVEHREMTREGEGPRSSFARVARSWMASATLRAGRASLTGGAEAGTVEDRMAGGESPFGRVWGRIGGAWERQSAWASVERTSGTSVETGTERDRLSGALGVALQPSADTRVSLTAQAGRAAWTEEPDGMLDATVEQRLPGGHTLRLRARAFPWADAGRRKPVVLLDYAVPLRVPVGRASDAGVVSGRVVDVETDRPVADALVRVGDRAVVTDARGRWAVAGLAPGRYAVEIDPVSVGVGRVVVRPDALSVDVSGGRSHAVEIGISRGARVHGAVLLPASGGVEGVVLEMRRGEERRRRVTDAEGRFVFADLEPGRWTLAVVRADLPPHHAMERESVEIEIAPGATEQVALRAVARRREMRIVAGGEVVLGGAAARGGAPAALPSAAPQPAPLPPGRLPPGVAIAPKPSASRPDPALPAPADSVAPPPAPRVAIAERAARRNVERPWRVRGESGLSDWGNDSYVVQPGDESLTAIAWLAYRDGTLWPKIWLANRDILPAPDRMEPGMELIIPPFAPLTHEERAAARQHRARSIRR
jgi:nucleoid-associated protein YgaU